MGEALAIGRFIYGALFVLYWGAAAYCLYLALSWPKTLKSRTACAAIVVAVFGFFPGMSAVRNWKEQQYKNAAVAHFKKRCTEAGEKIYRVVEDVDAIFLAKPRVRASDAELQDQFWMGDPYGYSGSEAMDPAGAYLYDRSGKTISDVRFTPIKGYTYVEMPNPAHQGGGDSKPYMRYHLEWRDIPNETIKNTERRLVPVGEPVAELRSRYGVTWADISTAEDRKHWVAGGSLTIFDIKNNQVVGERIGYVFDPGLGNTSGGRQVWPNSFYCPRFENHLHRNKEFVAKVLKASGVPHGK